MRERFSDRHNAVTHRAANGEYYTLKNFEICSIVRVSRGKLRKQDRYGPAVLSKNHVKEFYDKSSNRGREDPIEKRLLEKPRLRRGNCVKIDVNLTGEAAVSKL